MNDRILQWDGCINVRDLGGLRTRDGRVTRRGALIRSDTPARLSPAGWADLYAYGVRTIVTLYTHGLEEPELTFTCPYPDVATHRVAIEDVTDREFVVRWASTDLWATPMYYSDALRRWPERHAAAISALARPQTGGVLYHCIRGNDRTGIISLLLLALVGVEPEEMLADYQLSPDEYREEILAREHTSVREVILAAFSNLDARETLQTGGATPSDLSAIQQRLLG